MKRFLILVSPCLLLLGCQHAPKQKPVAHSTAPAPAPAKASIENGAYVFGWGFQPDALAKPRGGTSRGGGIKLAPPVERKSMPGETAFNRDRAAILAMAGDFKTSFHFMETLGLTASYTNTRPYHSWATEHVSVLEDRGEFISLQHTLVMFFAGENGKESKPMLTKHWRQDWTYQNTNLHVFKGDNTWARERRSPESVKGAWSQAVFHVDDEPRYTAVGRWKHSGDVSRWMSEPLWRPLPRREFSVRNDYDVLEGRHQIIITPTGWVHEQDNWKRVAGDSDESAKFLAQELGIDRYERIASPSLAAADDYWKKTAPYWAAVRAAWRDIFANHERFTIVKTLEGMQLFELHFAFAEEMAEGKIRSAAECERHAREAIDNYLRIPSQ